MSTHRIVCTRLGRGPEHEHIAAVGVITETGDPVGLWSIEQVRRAMFAGDFLYTEGDDADDISWVESYTCTCGVTTIRTDPDSTAKSSLATVPACTDDDECSEVRFAASKHDKRRISIVDLAGRRPRPIPR